MAKSLDRSGNLFVKASGIAAVLMGAFILAAWLLDLHLITDYFPSLIVMKVNTALGLILLGVGVLLLGTDDDASSAGSWRRTVVGLCAVLVGVLGWVTMAQYAFDVDLGLDQLLVRDMYRPDQTSAPGRMAFSAALSFGLLAGGMLAMLTRSRMRYWISQSLFLVSWFASLASVVGYGYGVDFVSRESGPTTISPHGALILLGLSTAFLALGSQGGFMAALANRGLGGRIFRKQLAPLVFVTLFLGGLSVWGEDRSYFSPRVGTLLYAVSVVAVFLAFSWRNAWFLNRVEKARNRSEQRIRVLLRSETAERQKAEKAVKTRDDLMAMVSHDLKNPIAAILINAQMLERAPGFPADAQKYVAGISNTSRRMERLVSEILDIAKIESGTFALDLRAEDVRGVCEEAVAMFQALAHGRKILLTAEVPPSCPAIAADRERILQVLSNLIGNALKCTDAGGRISISAEPRIGCVLFAVKDTGRGIAPDHLPHIFDRFWQAPGMHRKGTGLGLTIVQGIVEAHGGGVCVDSELGKGTTLYFTVPMPEALPSDLRERFRETKKSA